MGRDVSTTINMCSSVDGRVRLTTKNGVTFDAVLVRWEFSARPGRLGQFRPKSVVLIEPIGFTVAHGEFVPEVLRVAMNRLVDAGRAEAPVAVPDAARVVSRPLSL
jgi:hypothetical protein